MKNMSVGNDTSVRNGHGKPRRDAGAAERLPFSTSTVMDYFTEPELVKQIGFQKSNWPIALLKEAIDNSLDACEREGVPPVVDVSIDDEGFSVQDNGPGFPPETVSGTLDFTTRTSTNSRYVGPNRGRQGNATKCFVAAGAVLFPNDPAAAVTIDACGVRQRIMIHPDPISGDLAIVTDREPPFVKTGTFLRIGWPGAAGCLAQRNYPLLYNGKELLAAFALFNPGASIRRDGKEILPPNPVTKWTARQPACPRWYQVESFRDLLAANIDRERRSREQGSQSPPRTLRDFLARNFNGMTSSARVSTVLENAGLSGKRLDDLVCGRDLDLHAVRLLLRLMQTATRPVKAKALGCIGEANWRRAMTALYGVSPKGIRYKRIYSDRNENGLPFVIEAAFGSLPYERRARVVRVGINWTPCLELPVASLSDYLAGKVMIDGCDPAFIGLHIVMPGVKFRTRSKSQADFPPDVIVAAERAIRLVAQEWTARRKHDRREEDRISRQRYDEVQHGKPGTTSLQCAAFGVMVEAHTHVTGGATGAPVKARQFMYATRNLLLTRELPCWEPTRSATFTQKILPAFIEARPDLTEGWNIVYDARGRLTEPHGGQVVELGTAQVRAYARGWRKATFPQAGALRPANQVPTLAELARCINNGAGPVDRYRFVLLVEKEGFADLLEHARIAQRFDVAIASTKGMSTTAARELVDMLSRQGVTVLCLHDFDKSGFGILHTLRTSNHRYKFQVEKPLVEDIGLRLTDVREMDLKGEVVEYRMRKYPGIDLAKKGATTEEIEFLVEEQTGEKAWRGQRVELNEMTVPQFVSFLERKLTAAGAKKLIPPPETLSAAFLHTVRDAHINVEVEKARRKAQRRVGRMDISVPDDLPGIVARILEANPTFSWNQAIEAAARERLLG
jgi:hypothetical protein